MIHIDHIEDDPSNPAMCVAYSDYGTANQIAWRVERASILTVDSLPQSFIEGFQS